MRRMSLLAGTLLCSACFSYHNVPITAAGPGAEVRVILTDAGTATVTPAIGTFVTSLEGTVRSANEQAITIALSVVSRRGAGESRWDGEEVTLHPADIRQLDRKEVAKKRSWMSGGLLVAGGAAIITVIANAKGKATGNGRPTVPGT